MQLDNFRYMIKLMGGLPAAYIFCIGGMSAAYFFVVQGIVWIKACWCKRCLSATKLELHDRELGDLGTSSRDKGDITASVCI